MSEERATKIKRHEQALEFERSLDDPLARELVANACATVWLKFCEGTDLPEDDFDLEFFARVMHELFADREHFVALLRAAAGRVDHSGSGRRHVRQFHADVEQMSLN
jgi:hypothetical protein